MSGNIIIRPPEEPEFGAQFSQEFREVLELRSRVLGRPITELLIQADVLPSTMHVAAFDDTGVVGAVRLKQYPAAHRLLVERLVVDPQYGADDIGSRLLAFALERAQENGARNLVVRSPSEQIWLFSAVGFRATGYFVMQYGETGDEMIKPLNATKRP